MTGFMSTVMTVFRKEMWEHFKTWRLIVIGSIFAFVFIVVSLYGGILVGQGSTQFSFRSGANSVLTLVLSFTSFFPGLMAIVISYTAIVGERSRKSLILLASKPVKRPALFAGKFLSSYFSIVLVYIVVMTAGYLGVIGASGKAPSPEEVGRAYGAVGFVLLTMACWVVFSMFLSSLLRNPITVAVSAIMIWLLVIPIASSVGQIYWLVTTESNQNVPNDIGVSMLGTSGQGTLVTLTGSADTSYSVSNGTGSMVGLKAGDTYSVPGLPVGNYTWNASGGGIDSNGTLVIDGVHRFSVRYDAKLTVLAPGDLDVALTGAGKVIEPAVSGDGPFRNYTYSGRPGACMLVISNGERVLFSGRYDLSGRARGGIFAAASTGDQPDYVTYNQLMNPNNAMTGYTQVLNPDSRSNITPSEGAGALAIFFLVFLALGLLVFTKMEMI